MVTQAECLLALGEAKAALATIEALRAREPLNQHVLAFQATAWRMLGDPRYRDLYDYDAFVRSFVDIADPRIKQAVDEALGSGVLWPSPLVQLNPAFEPGRAIDDLVGEGVLHRACSEIFRARKTADSTGFPMRLHKHQDEAIRIARTGANYVLTTGTGSGKSLSYIIPIVDHVLRNGTGKGIQAIAVRK